MGPIPGTFEAKGMIMDEKKKIVEGVLKAAWKN